MQKALTIGLMFASIAVAPVAAAPISISSQPTGDPGTNAPSFTWQGLEFTLQSQPGPQESAAHRVQGQSDGDLNITLEEGATSQNSGNVGSAKVTYGTNLPEASHFKLGFEQLDTETTAFANLQGFFRNPAGVNGTVAQLLVGTDSTNAGSPFAGVNTRSEGESSFQENEFVDNTGLDAPGQFVLDTKPDGTTSGTVRIDNRSTNVTRDLSTLSNFRFDELLLQVETFQQDTDFQSTFSNGQTFTYTSATVPTPGSLALLAFALISVLGLGAVMRRATA